MTSQNNSTPESVEPTTPKAVEPLLLGQFRHTNYPDISDTSLVDTLNERLAVCASICFLIDDAASEHLKEDALYKYIHLAAFNVAGELESLKHYVDVWYHNKREKDEVYSTPFVLSR